MDTWSDAQFQFMQLPTGAGKSFIARGIQLATNAAIITHDNNLIESVYMRRYGEHGLNYLIGAEHYYCTSTPMSCKQHSERGDGGIPYCVGCPYVQRKGEATNGTHTIFNPLSYYYMPKREHNVIILDEAHRIAPQLCELAAGTFTSSKEHKLPDTFKDLGEVIAWVRAAYLKICERITRAKMIALEGKDKEVKASVTKLLRELEYEHLKIMDLINGLDYEPEIYEFKYENKALIVRPAIVPRFILKRFFGDAHVIGMSATIFEPDRNELSRGSKAVFKDFDSPIPANRRQVHHIPTAFKMNMNTPLSAAAEQIKRQLAPGENTIIHAPYRAAKDLATYFSGALVNTAEEGNKKSIMAKFMDQGGTWIAAGIADGVDLPGDLCRRNIIYKMLFPPLEDPFVKKRRSMPDGQMWYDLETLKTTIQQAGRSTRAPDDWSVIVILDPNFSDKVKRWRSKLPKSFLDSILWRKSSDIAGTISNGTRKRVSD